MWNWQGILAAWCHSRWSFIKLGLRDYSLAMHTNMIAMRTKGGRKRLKSPSAHGDSLIFWWSILWKVWGWTSWAWGSIFFQNFINYFNVQTLSATLLCVYSMLFNWTTNSIYKLPFSWCWWHVYKDQDCNCRMSFTNKRTTMLYFRSRCRQETTLTAGR